MTDDALDGQWCSLGGCTRPAADGRVNGALCERHLAALGDESAEADEHTQVESEGDCPHDHENPIDVCDVTDAERAAMLRELLEAYVDEFGRVPRLMPLDEEGKAPIIQGRCRLDSPEGRSYLVDGDEAIRQIREEGARGFAIYAGKRDHHTEPLALVDHDEDAFPAPTGDPTLEVTSGSGGADGHEYYRNDPADPVANARVGDNLGEIRAENWYCVAPGSVHPSGGVYHVREHREIATLSDDELEDSMRPASGRQDRERTSPVTDADGEGERPADELEERLERAFANDHDGERIKKVYNGRYKSAGFDDRSAAEFWLANRLDSWVARGDRGVVESLMDDANLQKWAKRDDSSYRGSVLSEVGYQDWYFDPERGQDVESVAVLPNSPKTRATARGFDWTSDARDDGLTIDAARERTQQKIEHALEHCDQSLIEALPTLGKSYGAIAAAAATDTPITVLTGRGNKEQYEQFREWADEHDLTHYTLPSFARDCDTANGEHGAEWQERVMDWYRRGATPKDIHAFAEYELGEPLPCQAHEGQECPYSSKWRFEPDDYDVLIGHYTHAHRRTVTQGRSVILDEFPGGAYQTNIGDGRLARAVTTFLQDVDALPFDDYAGLMDGRTDQQRRADALAWFDDEDLEPDSEQAFRDGGHAVAPLVVFTLLAGAKNDLGNGWERAEVGEGRVGLFDREQGNVHLLTPPALTYARSVVALDGTPTKRMWERSLGTRLNHQQVLSNPEREEYVREALNLNLIRTTEWVKPYNSADHVSTDRDAALLEAITDEHGERPALITTATAEDEYNAAGVLEHASATKHYGNVLGSNEFGEERLGAVIGSQHYGDQFIEKWGAFDNETVARNSEKGAGLEYGAVGDELLTHMREHETLQAAMRFGRDGNGAVVYVHTDTLPEWVPVAGEGRVVTTWSDGMRQVVDALQDLEAARTKGIAEHPAVDVGERQVLNVLAQLVDRGVLSREQDATDGRAFVWRDDGLHRLSEHGEVDLESVELAELSPAEVDEIARSTTIYTWDFLNRGDEKGGSGSPTSGAAAPASNQGESAVSDSPERDRGAD